MSAILDRNELKETTVAVPADVAASTPPRLLVRVIRRLAREGLPLLGFLALLPFLLICVLVIRGLAPVYLIRLKELYSHRFGHFAIEPEIYLARRHLAERKRPGIDLFCLDRHPVSNRQLARMWARHLHIWPLVGLVRRANKLLPGWERHEVPWDDVFGQSDELIRTAPFLDFSAAEIAEGDRRLNEILGARRGPIVCLFNRDSAYLDKHAPYQAWTYHDYRDSEIETYIPAMEWLAEQGYVVIRMGAVVKTPLPEGLHPNIIDYATVHRDEFMDIFIPYKCVFQLVAPSGPSSLGNAFRKPQGYINAAPFLTTTTPKAHADELVIPKLYFSEKENRILSIAEIVAMDAGHLGKGADFQRLGLRVVDNDAEDIVAITKEIEGIVAGTRPLNDDDRALQKKFWQAAGVDFDEARHYPQPSPGFLRRHHDVLFTG